MCVLVLAGRSVGRANSHVCERKRPPVGEFGDPFIGGPIGVRCLRLDSDEYRLVASLRRLERRGELERMARDDTIVMIRGGDSKGCAQAPGALLTGLEMPHQRAAVHRRALVDHQSARSAIIGSTRDARCAGA